MRILHTSDWHIGRQFHNVSLLEDQAFVLDQIVDMIRDQQVDVVLIAGDIYDRSVPPASAVALLDDVFNRICQDLKTPIIIISGNHDGPERLSFGARQLAGAGLHIIGTLSKEPQSVTLEDQFGKVIFYGIPYTDPATVRNVHGVEVSSHEQALSYLLSRIQEDHHANQRSVVLSHVFLDGGEVSESERPLSVGGLDTVSPSHYKSFNYAALGHLHGPQHRLTETIRYSGSILKYSFSEERHRKSVTMVDLDDKGTCEIQQIALTPKRDLRVLEGSLSELLKKGESDPGKEDYLLVRLTDTHAILDIMNKLRDVYPNVLHLERPGLMAATDHQVSRREHLQKGELFMVKDFFLQVSGEELTQEQSSVIENVLEAIHQEEDI